MPTELPFVDEPTKAIEPEKPVRKSEKEVFNIPEKNIKMELETIKEEDGTELSFPKTAKPETAIDLPKKKGKPRGHAKDPEKMKEHMAKMRAKSAETRARKKAEKEAMKKGKQPARPTTNVPQDDSRPTTNLIPDTPPNTPVENPQYSQPVEADVLRKKLEELEKQNTAYKNWYQQNKHHLNQIPQQKPVQQQQPVYDNRSRQSLNMNQGLDRLTHLEAMIRKDEREKLLQKQKSEREEQAKNLANARNKMPHGLRKWQSLPAKEHYSNNVDMWSKCFDPK